jgi:hypothetical protein
MYMLLCLSSSETMGYIGKIQFFGVMLFVHCGYLLLAMSKQVSAGKPFNVSFDHRALIIDGSRRMLISAGIHYPRAAPEMWPDILAKAKEGGADVVQTYVFWDGHEPQPGMYNFNGRYDLPKFVKLVAEAGMYLHLRIGPYVCAEWNFGFALVYQNPTL